LAQTSADPSLQHYAALHPQVRLQRVTADVDQTDVHVGEFNGDGVGELLQQLHQGEQQLRRVGRELQGDQSAELSTEPVGVERDVPRDGQLAALDRCGHTVAV